ncbi:MAG: hypothetical protein ABW022_22570 [Actinoplanes sp.]
MIRSLVLLAACAVAVGWASPAAAHAGGLVATDARSRVVTVIPAVDGLTVSAIEDGARLRIRNHTGRAVGVPGGGGAATPAVVADGRSFTWADSRSTPVGRDSGSWELVLDVGGSPVTVAGVIEGSPPPAPLPWWLAVVVVAAAVPLVARSAGRADLLLAALGLVAMGASLTHVIGSTMAVESAPALPTFVSAAGINLLAWPLIAGGAVVTVRGRAAGVLAVCAGAALTAVFVLPDVTSFHRAVLPFAGAAVVERVLVLLALGVGVGVAVAGAPVLRGLAARSAA